MKKTIILLGLAVSFFALAGCASKGASDEGVQAQAMTETVAPAKDDKNEASVVKQAKHAKHVKHKRIKHVAAE